VVSKRNPDQSWFTDYCDVVGCEQESVKVLRLESSGFWASFFGRQFDRFDLCWKHYISNLQQFKEVRESIEINGKIYEKKEK
jgi:hypothetical protein